MSIRAHSFYIVVKTGLLYEAGPLTLFHSRRGPYLMDSGAAGTYFGSRSDCYKAIRATQRRFPNTKYATHRIVPA